MRTQRDSGTANVPGGSPATKLHTDGSKTHGPSELVADPAAPQEVQDRGRGGGGRGGGGRGGADVDVGDIFEWAQSLNREFGASMASATTTTAAVNLAPQPQTQAPLAQRGGWQGALKEKAQSQKAQAQAQQAQAQQAQAEQVQHQLKLTIPNMPLL